MGSADRAVEPNAEVVSRRVDVDIHQDNFSRVRIVVSLDPDSAWLAARHPFCCRRQRYCAQGMKSVGGNCASPCTLLGATALPLSRACESAPYQSAFPNLAVRSRPGEIGRAHV